MSASDWFYIPTRYPDALLGMLPLGVPTQADAHEALDVARNTLTQITRVIVPGGS